MKNTTLAKQEIEKAFGPIDKITPSQMWTLVKLMKHARLRCRSNAALNNWLNAVFGSKFQFRQEPKEKPSRYNPAVIEKYEGLVIRDVKTREKVGSGPQDEDDE